MKKVFILFPLTLIWIFTACSDKEPVFNKEGLIQSISEDVDHNYGATNFAFDYDRQGRVSKVGTNAFYYGANGKVSHSRSHRSNAKGNFWGEEIRRLSYHWDSQGRLMEVFMDSLYVRSTSDQVVLDHIDLDGDHFDNLVKNVRIARFIYEGSSHQPQAIHFRRVTETGALREGQLRYTVTIEPEVESTLYYQNENVVREDIDVMREPWNLPVSMGPGATFKRYSHIPHYLYPVYRQLGFHPYRLDEVVSPNLENQAIAMMNGVFDPKWEYTQPYTIQVDGQGRVSDIAFQIPVVRGAIIHKSAFRSQIVVRYY